MSTVARSDNATDAGPASSAAISSRRTRRGAILVRNPEALRIRACLCNESVKNHFEQVLRGVYPTEEAQR